MKETIDDQQQKRTNRDYGSGSSDENDVLSGDDEKVELKKRCYRKNKKKKKRKKFIKRETSDSHQEVSASSDENEAEDNYTNNAKKKELLMNKISEILEEEENKIDSCQCSASTQPLHSDDTCRARSSKRNSISSKNENIDNKKSKCKSYSGSPSRSRSKSQIKNSPQSRRKNRSTSRQRSRSGSRRRNRSKSQRSCSTSRGRGRSRSRKRSRSKKRSRSRSRKRSRSKKRSRSRSRKRSRSKRKSRSRSRRRSRSRKRSRSRSRRRSRSRKRSRSRSRRRSRSGKRSRSTSRKRRSRSSSKRRSSRRSPTKERNDTKSQDSTSENNEKKSSLWDVTSVTENDHGNLPTSDSIFQRVGTVKRNNIEIKYNGGNDSSKEKENKASQPHQPPKVSPYGKWETVPNSSTKTSADLRSFTELCQKISAKESFYGSEDDEHEETGHDNSNQSEEKEDDDFHHPFAVKPAPIILPQLTTYSRSTPMNPAQAIMSRSMKSITANPADIISGPLEKHFPVSSGNDHRVKENVEGKAAKLPVYAEPVADAEPVNVSAVIARRLGAQQRLTANPNDVSARKVLNECDTKLKGWSDRNKKPGKFTGECGVRMDKKEIAGAIETWVRKDFFHNLQPMRGGIGMRMLENMGWKQGTPLGRNNEGYVAPITFDVKVGRGGLTSYEEKPAPGSRAGGGGNYLPKKRLAAVPNVGGKHPVSALAELCTKKKFGQPSYSIVFENGPSNNKNFLMKVTVENVDYQATVASPNKKHAKAQAAMTALKILGFANL